GALRGRELDLAEHLLDGQRVGLGIAGLAIERAELAVGDAHVRVVRVRVDHERDDLLRVARIPRLGGERAELEQGRLVEEPAAFDAVEPLAGERLVANRRDHASAPSRSQTWITL